MVVGNSDHDYTRPRTPPDAEKMKVPKLGGSKPLTPKPRGKENRELQVKKEALDKRKMTQPPTKASSRLAFRPRNQMEEYNVLYSFLIRGGCLALFVIILWLFSGTCDIIVKVLFWLLCCRDIILLVIMMMMLMSCSYSCFVEI